MNLDLLSMASVQIALACVAIWAICRLFPRMSANWRCWLWRLVGIKCMAVLWLAPVPLPIDRATVPAPAVFMTANTKYAPIRQAIDGSVNVPESAYQPQPIRQTWRNNVYIRANNILLGLSALWWIGFGFMTLRTILALRKVKRVLRTAYPHPTATAVLNQVQERAEFLQAVRIRIAPDLGAPAVVGLRHPTILLPDTSVHEDEAILESAIAHELAHVRRNDLRWVLAGEACRAIFWFHPLIWLACREQHAEAEIAADKLARQWVGVSPREYGRHLLTWLDRPSILTQSPGLMLSTHELGRRLKAMSLNPYRRSSSVALGAFLSIPLALTLVPMRFQVKSTGFPEEQIVDIPAARGTMNRLFQTKGEAAEQEEGDFQWKTEGLRKRGLARLDARGTDGKIYSAPLDGGGKVELLGLTHLEVGKCTSWSADGTQLPYVLPVVPSHSWQPETIRVIGPGQKARLVDQRLDFRRHALIRVSNGYRGINGVFLDSASGYQISKELSDTMPVAINRKKDILLSIDQSFPKELATADLSLWYYKPLRQVGAVRVEAGRTVNQPSLPNVEIIPYGKIGTYLPQLLMSDTRKYANLPDFFVSSTRPLDPRDNYRVAILLKNGKTLPDYYVSPSEVPDQPKTPKRSFFWAKGAKATDIAEIRIYITRPEQVTFKNVRLHPVR